MTHLCGLRQGRGTWNRASLQPACSRQALFVTMLELSWESAAVTWPITHLYENIPHVGAFSFHQDVFLDVQPKHSHFLFLPISLSSGPRYHRLIQTVSPHGSPSKFRYLTAYAWTALAATSLPDNSSAAHVAASSWLLHCPQR